MAGVLGVRLAGPVNYDGIVADKPWIGNGSAADVNNLINARKVYHRACLLAWITVGIIMGIMAWLG